MVDFQAGVFFDRQGINIGQFQSIRRRGQLRVKRAEVPQEQFHFPRLTRRLEGGRWDIHSATVLAEVAGDLRPRRFYSLEIQLDLQSLGDILVNPFHLRAPLPCDRA